MNLYFSPLFFLLATSLFVAADAAQPNVLIILADDFGWGDMSLHGGKTPTPALDRLFKEGVELTNFMVNPVCSPTRASLLTGRHSLTLRVGPQTGHYLKKDELTLAAAFKANGYQTGLFGKWDPAEEPADDAWRAAAKTMRVGLREAAEVKGSLPFGWDESTTFYTGGVNSLTRKTYAERVISWFRNDKYAPDDEGFASDLLMRDAFAFMLKNKSRPFLCYLPLQLIHGPITPQPEMLTKVDAAITDPAQRAYAAYILHLDEVIAKTDFFLDQWGLKENTITLFFSDNGATSMGCNLPFRGGKHSVFDGGVHVPAALRWPAGLKRQGSYEGLLSATDVMPTLASMCKVKADKPNYDGKDCWAALRDNRISPVESLYWVWDNHESLRTANWKLMTYHDHAVLYDLQSDPAETRDVYADHADTVNELAKMQDIWRATTNVALASQPCTKIFAQSPPQPTGDVLEILVEQQKTLIAGKPILLPICRCGHNVLADDWLEFDIMVPRDSIRDGFFLTPTRRGKIIFGEGRGVDQFNRSQSKGPSTRVPAGQWEHRVIGLSSEAPLLLGDQIALAFAGKQAGNFHLFIDNVRIRRGDGTLVNLWSDAKDNLKQTISTSSAFSIQRIHATPWKN